jgi:hypothetical protein
VKVCVIGNSHLAAVKLGHDRIAADHPAFTLHFFGAEAASLWGLQREGTVLAPKNARLAGKLALTSGGAESIETRDYDAFVLVGLFFGMASLAQLFAGRRPFGTDNPEADLMSRPFIRAAAPDVLAGSLAVVTAAKIIAARQGLATRAPILLIPTPLPSEAAQRQELGVWRTAHTTELLWNTYAEACRSLSGKLPFELLDQPSETTLPPAYTRETYSAGSVRLSAQEAHPEDDILHMNGEYGALVLKAALDRLSGGPPAPPAQAR